MDSQVLAGLKEYFINNGTKLLFRSKSVISQQSEKNLDVYMVTDGMVKNYSIDQFGEERTVSIFRTNQIFPVDWLLLKPSKNGRYFYYEAFSDVICYRLSRSAARDYLAHHSDVMLTLLDTMTKDYVNLSSRVQSLQKSKISEKTEFVLYYLAMSLGETRDGKIFQIKKPVTQQDIAGLTGVTRETAARFLTRIQNKKLAWKNGQSYYVDVSKVNSEYKSPIFQNPAGNI